MTADLVALAERVEALDGPDRGVDHLLVAALGWQYMSHEFWRKPDGKTASTPPAYTASLDAVTALIAEKLPGWQIEQMTWEPVKNGRVTASIGNFGEGDAYRMGEGIAEKPALALLAAALRALGEQHERAPQPHAARLR